MTNQIVSKFGVSELVQKSDQGLENGVKRELCTILGSANGLKIKDGTYGVTVGLQGVFEIETSEGKRYTTTLLYLPESALALVKPKPGDTSQFALKIGVEGNERSITGYSYAVEPLIEMPSPFEMIRKQIASKSNAPKFEPQPESKPESTSNKGKK